MWDQLTALRLFHDKLTPPHLPTKHLIFPDSHFFISFSIFSPVNQTAWFFRLGLLESLFSHCSQTHQGSLSRNLADAFSVYTKDEY